MEKRTKLVVLYLGKLVIISSFAGLLGTSTKIAVKMPHF